MAGEPQEAGSDRAPADRWLRGLACVAGAVLASALILVIVQIGRVNERRQAAVAAERHSYDVILLTASISGAIGRAEAALGRYVIDPKAPRQGSIYYAEWVAAGRQIDRLERAVANDGAQRAEAARLRTLFEVRGHELAAPAGHAFYRKYLPALSTYYQAGKQPTIAAIARSLGRIEATAIPAGGPRAGDGAGGGAGRLAGRRAVSVRHRRGAAGRRARLDDVRRAAPA